MASFTNTQNAFYSTAVIWSVVTSCSIIGLQLKVETWTKELKLKDIKNLVSLLAGATAGAVGYFAHAISKLHVAVAVWLPWALIPVLFPLLSGLVTWLVLRRKAQKK